MGIEGIMTRHYPNLLPFRKLVWQMLSLLYFGGQQAQEFSRGIDNPVKLNPLDLAIDCGSFFFKLTPKARNTLKREVVRILWSETSLQTICGQDACSGLDP